MTQDQLGDLLARLSDPVGEVDLAERAWAAAVRSRRRRRRTVLGAVATVAAVAAVSIGIGVLPDHGRPAAPLTPGPASSSGASWQPGRSLLVRGASVTTGPRPDQIDGLTELRPGIPAQIGWTGPAERLPTLATAAGPTTRVVAAMTGRVKGVHVPVLLVRDSRSLAERYVQVQVALSPLGGTGGDLSIGLDARSIDPTGTRVVYVQADRVLIADASSGELHDVRLPSRAGSLTGGGFTDSGRVVVTADDQAWSISGQGTDVHQVPAGTSTVSARLVGDGARPQVIGYTDAGLPATKVPVDLPLEASWGASVGPRAWVATGALVDQRRLPAAVSVNGLFVASTRGTDLRAVLLMDDRTAAMVSGGIRATAWVDNVVIFQYSTDGRSWLLGWDPFKDKVYKISGVTAAVGGTGTRSQAVAVWLDNPVP